ncbi:MAG: hypothetical protein ACRDZ8_00215 [Acidimicrobiales bacterium]
MGTQRWVYILLIVVGVLFGTATVGLPSCPFDHPTHVRATTASTPAAQ